MYRICFNIGGSNQMVYNTTPFYMELDTIREFTDIIRLDLFHIILWAHDNYGMLSRLWLGVHIEDDDLYWDFIINVKNIREFEKYKDMSREEIDALRAEINRDDKLNDILK